MAFEYVSGVRDIRPAPMDADSGDLVQGQAVTDAGATDGFVKDVDASGERVLGIVASKASSPSADGGSEVLVDFSRQSVYRVVPDAGSMAVGDARKTCDVGADGLSINRDASLTDDIEILSVDVAGNAAYVRINPSFAGVA